MPTVTNKELKNFVDNVCDKSHLRVESDLGDGYFRLRATEAQRRQAKQDIRSCEDVIIEILRNSRDAGAKNIFVATNTEDSYRNITIIDDGNGVPKSHHKIIFEPYVTSKLDTMTSDSWGVHGRGMALYSISENCEKAYVVKSDVKLGCSLTVKCNTNILPEKTDQSTFPDFYVNDNTELVMRGPKNIIRTVCEFAVENRDKVNVYIGSPVEIAATLYQISKKNTSIKSVFCEPDDNTKIIDLLGYSSDVHDFKNYASEIGIFLSKRTARRIMDNEISAQISILEKITNKGIKSQNAEINKKSPVFDIFDIKKIYKVKQKPRAIKLNNEDKELLKNSITNQFANIADKYYLDKDIQPNIKIVNNKLTLSFDLSEVD